MTECPDPIDWLDLLEGRPGAAARPHLNGCPRCRAVVAAIRDAEAGPLRAPVGPPDALPEPSGRPPRQGDICWLETTGADMRLPVLITASEGLEGFVQVVPLWIDEDSATDPDVVLRPENSTTGLWWRVAFRAQALTAPGALSYVFGALTESGAAAIETAQDGQQSLELTGLPLESDHDPRLAALSWMDPVLAGAGELAATAGGGAPPAAGTGSPGALVIPFRLAWARKPSASHKLAAAPSAYDAEERWAEIDSDAGMSIRAILRTDPASDDLLLDPIAVSGLADRPVFLVIVSGLLESPETVKTTLAAGRPVVLAAGARGIGERDVEGLELHVR